MLEEEATAFPLVALIAILQLVIASFFNINSNVFKWSVFIKSNRVFKVSGSITYSKRIFSIPFKKLYS